MTETFNDDCTKEDVIKFLEKIKFYLDTQLVTFTYVEEIGGEEVPNTAAEFVCVQVAGGQPHYWCLNPIKGAQTGTDAEGNPVYAPILDGGILDLTKCCPVAPILIPTDAFADPFAPTQSEVNAWVVNNHPDAPPNTQFYYGHEDSGSPDDPDWVWSYDGNGNTINTESPDCCENVVHVQVPEGEDPAEWITANVGDYPAGTHFYTGDDPLAPTGVWTSDADGNILCDKAPSAITHVTKLVNGAGTALVADQGVNSDSFCVQEPLQNKAGAPLGKNAKVISESDNPFMNYECVNGSTKLTRCDGSGVCLVPTQDFSGSSGGVEKVSPSTEYGPLMLTESCHTIDIPECGPHRVRMDYIIGYNKLNEYQSNAAVTFSPEYSVNGGATWTSFLTAGLDAVIHTGPEALTGQDGESEFSDFVFPLLGSGLQTVCARTNYTNGVILAGGVSAFASTFRTSWVKMQCSDIPSLPLNRK